MSEEVMELSRLEVGGQVVHRTLGKRTHKRQRVPVQNAPEDKDENTYPNYSD